MPKTIISSKKKKCKKRTGNFIKDAKIDDISIEAKAVRKIFSKNAISKIAKEIGFIQRKRKLDAYNFFLSLSFGSLKSKTITLSAIVETMLGNISVAGVHERFNKEACEFFERVYAHCFKKVTSDMDRINVEVVNGFNRVNIIDSSSWKIPAKLKGTFPGYNEAGCKVQFMIDYGSGEIQLLDITEEIYPDQKYAINRIGDYVKKDDLMLIDMGYSIMAGIRAIKEKEGYFISRLNYHAINLYLKRAGEYSIVDLLALTRRLSREETVLEVECYGGNSKDKIKIRVIGIKLPEKEAAEKRRKIRLNAKRKGKSPTKKTLELSGWSFLITNIPEEKGLSVKDIMRLYPLRWNIELFFKQMKSILNIHRTEVRENAYRLRCEVLGKCILAMIISYCYGLARSYTWNKMSMEISFEKTVKLFKRTGSSLEVILLIGSMKKIKEFIRHMLILIVHTCKKNRQKSRKNTLDVLIEKVEHKNFKRVMRISQQELAGLTSLT